MKNRKYRKRKVPKYLYVISLGLFLFLGVGYSTLNSTFGVEGTLATTQNTWNVKFANVEYATGNVANAGTVSINNNTSLSFNVTLENPGDKYEFTFDIRNDGNLDAMISSIEMTGLTEEQQEYLTYLFTYSDGTEILDGDLLKVDTVKTAHVLIQYKQLRDKSIYPRSDVVLNLNIGINYYYPRQDNYRLLLTYGGQQANYKVSNLEQQLEINDLVISNDYSVVACNNGVVPSINNNGKLVVSNVKSDATCRLETSLKNAVNNSHEEKTNITLISDSTSTDFVSVTNTQDITIDLNGKSYTYNGSASWYLLSSSGNLTLNDTKGTGSLNTTGYNLISTSGTLNINGGSYNRNNSSTSGYVIWSSGIANLKNSSFYSDYSPTIVPYAYWDSYSYMNIENCVIENDSTSAIYSNSSYDRSIINIRNSTISTPGTAIFSDSSARFSLYLCGTEISNATSDFAFDGYSKPKIFYSNDTVFTNSTNNPTALASHLARATNSNIACLE